MNIREKGEIYLRVHGDKVIKRRGGVKGLKHYSDAKSILEQDFHFLCGYCGKDGKLMHQKFHIDHFVPKSLDAVKENDYYNLVLACPKCNLAKSNKCPTNDPKISNDGKVGFIDPATEEFDDNMGRNEQGYVIGKTAVGESMCQMLHLDIRRTDIYWKISQLREVQEQLEKIYMEDRLSDNEKNFYIEINMLMKKYIDDAFEQGE